MLISKSKVLLILDRDGTIIENDDFFGSQKNWRKELKLNKPVVDLLSYLTTKYQPTVIVISNQSGVARGLFTDKRVSEINEYVGNLLIKQGVTIQSFQFCPDVDAAFAQKNLQIKFIKKYVKQKTIRKPSIKMVEQGLKEISKKLIDFTHTLVIGNSEDDELLAKNLNSKFIDVRKNKFEELIREFNKL